MERWRKWALGSVVAALMAGGAACSDDSSDPDGGNGADDTSTTSTTVELPAEDLSIDIELGQLLFHQWADGSSRQLSQVSTTGGPATEVAIGDYGGVMAPTVGPDGRVAALAWPPGQDEQNTTVLIGDDGAGLAPLYSDPDLLLWCVRWLPDASGLLVTAFDGDELDPVLLSIDLDGNATSLTVPSGRYECALPLADDRIVLTYAGEGIDLVAMALVTPSSTEVEVLHSKVGCLLYGPSASWTRPELVVAASCEEPEDSGIHIIDLDTGEVEHIVEAEVAFPSFSPSGDWIVFGLFPSPDSLKSTVWAVDRTGDGLRQITDDDAAMPAWIAGAR